MKYLLLAILIILTLSITVSACNLASDFRLRINGTVPFFLPYSNERVNIFIGNETLGSLILENKVLTNLSCEKIENPTYVVNATNKTVLTDIFQSSSPLDKLDNSLSDGIINIEGQTTVKNIKSSLTKTLIKIFSWF